MKREFDLISNPVGPEWLNHRERRAHRARKERERSIIPMKSGFDLISKFWSNIATIPDGYDVFNCFNRTYASGPETGFFTESAVYNASFCPITRFLNTRVSRTIWLLLWGSSDECYKFNIFQLMFLGCASFLNRTKAKKWSTPLLVVRCGYASRTVKPKKCRAAPESWLRGNNLKTWD